MTGTQLDGGIARAVRRPGWTSDEHDLAGTPVTEIGVVVADRWQRHGVGSALTRALATRAQARGATALMMDVLAENHEMLALIKNHFPAARSRHDGPYVTVHVPLPQVQEEQSRECAGRTCGGCGAHGPHRTHRAHRERQQPERAAAGLPVG